jgi:predicted nucleic acid-binding protein
MEYQAGVQAALVPGEVIEQLQVIQLTADERKYAADFSRRLGAGERACLAACYYRKGVFASDDRDARTQAQQLQIPLIGTVGILVLCVRRQVLVAGEAQELLSRMIAFGYRSPVMDIKELLTSKN